MAHGRNGQRVLAEALKCLRRTTKHNRYSSDPRDAWYSCSYGVFAKAPQSQKDCHAGLIRIAAAAAAWTRIIPAAPARSSAAIRNLRVASNAVRAMSSARDVGTRHQKRKEFLLLAIDAFRLKNKSTSAVYLSKLLHFHSPKVAPMIDRHVAAAWLRLARRFRLTPTSILTASSPTREDYLRYWEAASQLVRVAQRTSPRFSYRDLDLLLFTVGKKKLRLVH